MCACVPSGAVRGGRGNPARKTWLVEGIGGGRGKGSEDVPAGGAKGWASLCATSSLVWAACSSCGCLCGHVLVLDSHVLADMSEFTRTSARALGRV